MNFDIIVAHYKEDIDWISQLNHNNIDNIYLYTKDIEYQTNKNIKNNNKIYHKYLSNIGREGHTYLYHIINNYGKLNDMNIFLQGRPQDHGIDTHMINKWIDNIITSNRKYSNNLWQTPLTHGLTNGRCGEWRFKTEPSQYDMLSWFKKFIRTNIDPQQCYIYFGANFAVSKDRILSQTIEKYQSIMNELNSINPEAGHYLERSWYYLFNLDQIS